MAPRARQRELVSVASTLPLGITTSAALTSGHATFILTLRTAGFYRVAATAPNGGVGWATVDVGTTPATAPPQ